MAWTYYTAPLAAGILPPKSHRDELLDAFTERLGAVALVPCSLDSATIKTSRQVSDRAAYIVNGTRSVNTMRTLLGVLCGLNYVPADAAVDYLPTTNPSWDVNDLLACAWASLGGSGAAPAHSQLDTALEFNLIWAALNLLTTIRMPYEAGSIQLYDRYPSGGTQTTLAAATTAMQGATESAVGGAYLGGLAAVLRLAQAQTGPPNSFWFLTCQKEKPHVLIPANAYYSSGARWRAWITPSLVGGDVYVDAPVELRFDGQVLSGNSGTDPMAAPVEMTGSMITTFTGSQEVTLLFPATESGGDTSPWDLGVSSVDTAGAGAVAVGLVVVPVFTKIP